MWAIGLVRPAGHPTKASPTSSCCAPWWSRPTGTIVVSNPAAGNSITSYVLRRNPAAACARHALQVNCVRYHSIRETTNATLPTLPR